MQACGSLEKTTFGQEREREQKHTTGQKRKQLGKRSPVQVEQKKKDLSWWDAVTLLHNQEHCELLLTLLPLIGHQWLEKRGETSCTELHHLIMLYAAATPSTLHYYVLCTVRRFDLVPPPVKYVQELKAVMSDSCVECEHTAAMWQRKELECNGSIRPGDVVQVQQLLQRFKSEWW